MPRRSLSPHRADTSYLEVYRKIVRTINPVPEPSKHFDRAQWRSSTSGALDRLEWPAIREGLIKKSS